MRVVIGPKVETSRRDGGLEGEEEREYPVWSNLVMSCVDMDQRRKSQGDGLLAEERVASVCFMFGGFGKGCSPDVGGCRGPEEGEIPGFWFLIRGCGCGTEFDVYGNLMMIWIEGFPLCMLCWDGG